MVVVEVGAFSLIFLGVMVVYKLKIRFNTLWKRKSNNDNSHIAVAIPQLCSLPIRVSASSPTPTAMYPCLPRPKPTPPWMGGVIFNMTLLRSFTLALCCQIYRSEFSYMYC